MIGVKVTRDNGGEVREQDVVQEGGGSVLTVIVDIDQEHREATRGGDFKDEDVWVLDQVRTLDDREIGPRLGDIGCNLGDLIQANITWDQDELGPRALLQATIDVNTA